MKVRYFEDTDTLCIELRDGAVAETRDLDENTLIDVDDQGRLVAITIEHARTNAGSGLEFQVPSKQDLTPRPT